MPPAALSPAPTGRAGRVAEWAGQGMQDGQATSASREPAASVQLNFAGGSIIHAAAAEAGPAGSPQHSTLWSTSSPQMKRPHWEADSME